MIRASESELAEHEARMAAIAKAAGNVAGAPVISIDTGAMKGSLVGESEAKINPRYSATRGTAFSPLGSLSFS